MLSILIPTYNYNVYPLAQSLEKQAIEANIEYEIICIDDGSLSPLNEKNEKINNLTNSKFIAATQNVGLSINRNTLAKNSKYDSILFIDGDSIIQDSNFLRRYIDIDATSTDIIYGGRVHPKRVERERKLRWKYGKHREDLNAQERKKNTYKCLLWNNTLIKKKVFNKIQFEKTITQYGHEDTIFSYNLSKLNTSVLHINNPVIHGDVDLNEVFFMKMHKSLENQNYIYKSKLIDPDFITFLKIFKVLKKFKINYLLAFIHKMFYPFFKFQLTSKNPSLFFFDTFRLSYFCYFNLYK